MRTSLDNRRTPRPAASHVSADQARGRRDQVGVVPRLPPVRQQRDVFHPRADAMPSLEPASIDRPTRYAIPVVNLLQRDARGRHDGFHPGGVPNGIVRIGVQRLDEDAPAAARQAGTHEGSRIFDAHQSSLETDASRQQQLAKLYDSRLALIGSDQVRHVLPGFDGLETRSRVSDNLR